VHLSPDVATALNVGARRGRPVVLRVDAAALAAEGATFTRSANGVWLVPAVPPQHLAVLDRP
jgi:putative RNA 2'-phosphotransferase